jgi:hypothetical protein
MSVVVVAVGEAVEQVVVVGVEAAAVVVEPVAPLVEQLELGAVAVVAGCS